MYGGLSMSWITVIALAVAAAVLTAIFLIVPVFENTSFERMGVYLEAWFFPAIIIMANCKKPLESALKTFVFFLISQPLIYLIQVPFSWQGWALFSYYKYWFFITLLTLPAAFIGWFITKRNWLSVLILAPVLAFMGFTVFDCGTFCLRHFPRLLVTVLFCILQIVLYIAAFFPDIRKKLVGVLIPIIVIAVMAFITPQTDINGTVFLPDDPVLTDSAVVITGDNPAADITVAATGENSMIHVHAKDYGTMDFSIKDEVNEYRYMLEVYEDISGHAQIRITAR